MSTYSFLAFDLVYVGFLSGITACLWSHALPLEGWSPALGEMNLQTWFGTTEHWCRDSGHLKPCCYGWNVSRRLLAWEQVTSSQMDHCPSWLAVAGVDSL